MDADIALGLVKHGATLLFLDVPQYTLIGIDTQMFSAGPAFKGIKMIPPGPHFIYYSSSNRDGNEFSPIVGFFIDAIPSEVIVRRWNHQEERLLKLSEEEEERYSQAVKNLEFDRHLGPYMLNQFGDWKRLSNYITKSIIERIGRTDYRSGGPVVTYKVDGKDRRDVDKNKFYEEQPPTKASSSLVPIGGEISVAYESGINESIPKTVMEKSLAEQLKGSKISASNDKPKRSCYYTAIPRVIKTKGICGEELTSLNLDKTCLLENILMKEYGGEEDLLLGELQFAFIAFLMGQSLEGFLQWKALVNLLLGCTEAPVRTRSQLFTKFIKVLYYQLKYGFRKDDTGAAASEKGALTLLDASCLSADSFLQHRCKDFFSLVLEARVIDGDLLSWTRKLKELLEKTLGWEFPQDNAVDGIHFEEDDEFAPVVVMPEDLSYSEYPTA